MTSHNGLTITSINVAPRYDGSNPRMLAMCQFMINGCIAVRGARLILGYGGRRVAMPDHRNAYGEWRDSLFPIDRATRDWLSDVLFAEYDRVTADADEAVEPVKEVA